MKTRGLRGLTCARDGRPVNPQNSKSPCHPSSQLHALKLSKHLVVLDLMHSMISNRDRSIMVQFIGGSFVDTDDGHRTCFEYLRTVLESDRCGVQALGFQVGSQFFSQTPPGFGRFASKLTPMALSENFEKGNFWGPASACWMVLRTCWLKEVSGRRSGGGFG